ncbi:hypothetical protein ACFXTO_013955 [Malus domestica]
MIKNITTFHSLLFHNNTTNHVQPNTSVLKQNAFIANGFNSSSSAASTSHEITVPNFLANDATLHGVDPDYVDFGPRNSQCQYCGALFWSIERLKTNVSSIRRPQFTACCMSQKVKFPPVKPTPAYLEHLLN